MRPSSIFLQEMQNAAPQVFQGIHPNCGREFQDYLAWHRLNSEVHSNHASKYASYASAGLQLIICRPCSEITHSVICMHAHAP